nr:PREDICTED: uncharacterized protein LOC103374297 [Stegastes partitus]
MEGQSILLTCSRTCAENLNSYSGYIWYKNRLQLNTSQVNSFYLSLHPVSKEDAGSYVCVLIGYKDFPSSAVNLIVQNRPRSIMSGESDDSRHENDSLPLPRSPKGKSLFRFPVVLVASVCFGLAVVITVAVLGLNIKKKKKRRRRCAASTPAAPDRNNHIYMTLNINSMSPEYDTLDAVRCSLADEADYENLPGNSLKGERGFETTRHL